MKKIIASLFLVVLSASDTLHAQDTLSLVTHHLFGFKDTVLEGAAVMDSIEFINHSSNSFNGTIKYITTTQDSTNHPWVTIDTLASGLAAPAGSSGYAQVNRIYNTSTTPTSGKFKIGINVVVIWPIFFPANPPFILKHDSLIDTVFIKQAFGIQELDVNALFSLYPNPSASVVTIGSSSEVSSDPEEVIIYDLHGKVCRTYQKQRIIDLGNLPPGTYLVQVKFRNGKRGRRKLLVD